MKKLVSSALAILAIFITSTHVFAALPCAKRTAADKCTQECKWTGDSCRDKTCEERENPAVCEFGEKCLWTVTGTELRGTKTVKIGKCGSIPNCEEHKRKSKCEEVANCAWRETGKEKVGDKTRKTGECYLSPAR